MIFKLKSKGTNAKRLFFVHYIVYFMIVFFFALYALPSILSVHAQESSPSASPSAASDSGVLSKIEDLKKEIASKAAVLKEEIDKKIGNKAFVGTITVMTVDTINIRADLGSRTIKIDEYTIYQDISKQKAKKALTLASLQTDDTIIALGEVDEKGVMIAKKIIRRDPLTFRTFQYLIGNIGSVESNQLVLRTKSGVEQTIGYSAKTPVRSGNDLSSTSEIKQSRSVIAVLESKEASQSSFLYLVPEVSIKTLGAKTATEEASR